MAEQSCGRTQGGTDFVANCFHAGEVLGVKKDGREIRVETGAAQFSVLAGAGKSLALNGRKTPRRAA
jgi:hypothetical protein